MNQLHTLPYELLYEILLNVDSERIIACRTVSYRVLCDTNFWLQKLDQEQSFTSESGSKHNPTTYITRYTHPDHKGINIYTRWITAYTINSQIISYYNDMIAWKINIAHPHCIIDTTHLDTAIVHGNLELLQMAYQYYKLLPNHFSLCNVTRNGNLPVLQWLETKGVVFDDSDIKNAVRYGHLHLLQWFEQRGVKVRIYHGMWAYDSGRIDIVEWFHARGIYPTCGAGNATENGHLQLLQWLVKQGMLPSSYNMTLAAWKGHLHTIQWIIENKVIPITKSDIQIMIDNAARGGHLPIIQYLAKGKIYATDTANYAAENGHLDILEWLGDNNVLPNNYGADLACKSGHLHIIQWLKKRGVTPTVCGANNLCCYDHTDALQWLRTHNIYPDSKGADLAAEKGHLTILKYLDKHNIRATQEGINLAAKKGHLTTLYWFAHKGRYPNGEGCKLVRNGNVERWLKKKKKWISI